jgi:hypothetical protein
MHLLLALYPPTLDENPKSGARQSCIAPDFTSASSDILVCLLLLLFAASATTDVGCNARSTFWLVALEQQRVREIGGHVSQLLQCHGCLVNEEWSHPPRPRSKCSNTYTPWRHTSTVERCSISTCHYIHISIYPICLVSAFKLAPNMH